MSRWEVRGRWIESHNGIWLIGCSMSCWELEASCSWGKNSHPPSLSAKASKGSIEHTEGVLAHVGCSTSTLLWWKARNEGSENWGFSVFKSNHVPMCWQLLLAQSRGSVFYFLWETKAIPSRCLSLWGDSLHLYSDKSRLKSMHHESLHLSFIKVLFWLNLRE